MLRAVILAGAVAGSLAVYFLFSLYILPQSYQESVRPLRPEPVITSVKFSASYITLGDSVVIFVSGTNNGEKADMQIVSVGFPNLTSSDAVRIIQHDFRQQPERIEPGDQVGAGYQGTENLVAAQHPSIEAFSWPWEAGSRYSIQLQVEPPAEGLFVIFVKSVALPHSWNGAHYPQEGTMDYQREFVDEYFVVVANP